MARNRTDGIVYVIDVDEKTGIAKLRKFDGATAASERKVKQHAKGMEKAWTDLDRAVAKFTRRAELFLVAGLVGGALASLEALRRLGGAALNTAADFETMRTSLETVTGSAREAQRVFEEITEFSARTPFQVPELVATATQLRAIGVSGIETIATLGDTAASFNRTIAEVTQAFINPQRETLIRYGIDLRQAGDTWKFTFADAMGEVQTIVSEGSLDVQRQTLLSIWNDRYAGGMDRLARTYSGLLSTLSDQWTLFLNDIGEGGLLDVFKGYVEEGITLMSEMRETGELQAAAKDFADLLVAIVTTGVEMLSAGAGHLATMIELADRASNVLGDLGRGVGAAFWEQQIAESRAAIDNLEGFVGAIRASDSELVALAETLGKGATNYEDFRAQATLGRLELQLSGKITEEQAAITQRAIDWIAQRMEAEQDLQHAIGMSAAVGEDAIDADERLAEREEALRAVTDRVSDSLDRLNERLAERNRLMEGGPSIDEIQAFLATPGGGPVTSEPSVFTDTSPLPFGEVSEPSFTDVEATASTPSGSSPAEDTAQASIFDEGGSIETLLAPPQSVMDASQERMDAWLEYMTGWYDEYDSLLLQSMGVNEEWANSIASIFDSFSSMTSSLGKILGQNDKFYKQLAAIEAGFLLVKGVISTYQGAVLIAQSIYPPNPPGIAAGALQISEGVSAIGKAKELGAKKGGGGASAPSASASESPTLVSQDDPRLEGASGIPVGSVLTASQGGGVVVQPGGAYIENVAAMDSESFRDFVTEPTNRRSIQEAQALED